MQAGSTCWSSIISESESEPCVSLSNNAEALSFSTLTGTVVKFLEIITESLLELRIIMLLTSILASPRITSIYSSKNCVATQFFELYIEVILGEARIEVRSIIMRSSNKDSVIISRNLTTVPVSVEKDSASALLDKLTQGSDSDSEMIDDQQVLPACIMIGA